LQLIKEVTLSEEQVSTLGAISQLGIASSHQIFKKNKIPTLKI
jgi:hypothetical protein